MTLATALDQAQTNGWDTLRGAAANGTHDLPPAFTTAYDALQALTRQQPPATTKATEHAELAPLDRIAAQQAELDWRNKRDLDADRYARQALNALQPYGRTIEDYIGAALDKRLVGFADDVAVLGVHAYRPDPRPDDAVVDAAGGNRKFADAWLRYTAAGSWYLALRQSWTVLRRFDQAPGTPDPLGLGLDSILAEVANAPDIRPDDWRQMRAGGQGGGSVGFTGPQPWPVPVPCRLAAILRDGGQLWMPSAAQQWAAYGPHTPQPPSVRDNMVRPFKGVHAA